MIKNELIGLLNISLLNSIRQRDKTDPELFPEEYGYYNGQYRTYETLISMLSTLDIESTSSSDSRNFVRSV